MAWTAAHFADSFDLMNCHAVMTLAGAPGLVHPLVDGGALPQKEEVAWELMRGGSGRSILIDGRVGCVTPGACAGKSVS